MPVNITVNGEKMTLENEITLQELLDKLKIPLNKIAVDVNGNLVPRTQTTTFVIKDGFEIEIINFVGGG